MGPVVTDGVVWSVSLSVTIVNPAKTPEPIEMPFGLWTRVGPVNHVLDGVQIPPWEGAVLRGRTVVKLQVYEIPSMCPAAMRRVVKLL